MASCQRYPSRKRNRDANGHVEVAAFAHYGFLQCDGPIRYASDILAEVHARIAGSADH